MGSQDKLIAHLESQGAEVRKTKKGIMIYGPPPTNGTFTMHNTPSDHRSLANDMAGLRRIGLTHPLDSKPLVLEAGEGYPPHVLNELAPRTEKKIREELHRRGWPLEATTSMLATVVAQATAEKGLYKLGYRYHPDRRPGRGKPNIWVANSEITGWHEELLKNHPVNSTPDVEVKLRGEERFDSGPVPDLGLKVREAMAGVPVNERTELVMDESSEPEPAPHVDFIDERDSWVVPMEELFSDYAMRLIDDQLRVLRAVGMDYEMRVWRKK
jgi:hypothetical protein